MEDAELEAKLEAMVRNAFETGAMAMQNIIARLLLKNDMPITAQSVMELPLPPYMPTMPRGAS